MVRLAGKRGCGNRLKTSQTVQITDICRLAMRETAGVTSQVETCLPGPRAIVLELLVMLGVALVLAALGPFDSFAMGGFEARLAYWLPAAFIGYAVMRPTLLAATIIGKRIELPANLVLLVGVILASAPLTLVLLWWDGAGFRALPPFADWLQFYGNVVIVAALVTLLFTLLEPKLAPARPEAPATIEAQAAPAKGTPAESPFLERLPAGIRDRLLALEMEDH